MVNDSRRNCFVPKILNSTYITLVPKHDSFNDFRPISLCNMIYKIITKIIINQLRPVLGKCISEEQFGFLPNKQILDVIGICTREPSFNQGEKYSSFYSEGSFGKRV